MKRFWKEVSVVAEDGGHGIRLDGRAVRTPGRLPLVIPSQMLAEAIAEEWRAVEGEIAPATMRLTGLANAAIERIAPDPGPHVAGIAAYGESDLTCYRAESPEPLIAREAAAWDPLLAWASARYDVHFEIASGVIHRPQPAATLARLAEAVAARDAFALAALAAIVPITGTLVGALALAEGAIDADTLWAAATVDEAWQAEQWGEDAEAARALAARRADYDAAARFLGLA
ncbi:ATPase [Sphingomonas gilva]|uniref:ATPase n=1 Tax=Sphingomonas gilva TaxID=2305907 RepID=A0A396S6J2_9SPHN|nr:ATP12 family protein [Sphingomonas gilva]RHW19035.1 ATPase [Sphingomonas gilva]